MRLVRSLAPCLSRPVHIEDNANFIRAAAEGSPLSNELVLLLAALFAVVNVFAFAQIYFDKLRAKQGKRRVPEKDLLASAILGGWPGSFLAQQLFRHKTKKDSFKIAFWIASAISVIGYLCLYSRLK